MFDTLAENMLRVSKFQIAGELRLALLACRSADWLLSSLRESRIIQADRAFSRERLH